MSFKDDLEDLETAEDFLRFLGVPFEQRVVHVNRLHILQRFHEYLSADTDLDAVDDDAMAARYRAHLTRAYTDFVASSAIAEKTFKVHKEEARKMADRFVSLDTLVLPRG
ncbi:nitrogenase-stabilizing/protective protein NifW [Azospirillum halopraeferens]|uniref:nitrogenase-stabilizing/protective protein NifW n=1 Tax=Azospirillum halopraeferens TaxID=34010 RepID=UPI00040AB92C|nr:nitrogenase-stabilizing/protective protein NifW [Azospirillum halopraeferens]